MDKDILQKQIDNLSARLKKIEDSYSSFYLKITNISGGYVLEFPFDNDDFLIREVIPINESLIKYTTGGDLEALKKLLYTIMNYFGNNSDKDGNSLRIFKVNKEEMIIDEDYS